MIKESEALKAIKTILDYCNENKCFLYDGTGYYCPLEPICENIEYIGDHQIEDIENSIIDAQIREEKEDGKMQLKCKECTEEKCIAREQAEIPEGFWLVGCLKKEGCLPNPLIAAPENAESPIILVYGEYEVKK